MLCSKSIIPVNFLQLPIESVSHDKRYLSLVLQSCSDGRTPVGLAYLWETTPVLGTRALPIYADDMFGLPGAPWVKNIIS